MTAYEEQNSSDCDFCDVCRRTGPGAAARAGQGRGRIGAGNLRRRVDGLYRGIPFAAPPVGDLRWRAPQPAAKWEGRAASHQFRSRSHSRSETSLWNERGLPVFERVDAGEIRARPHSRPRLDLRRRIQRGSHLRTDLQRGEAGREGRGAGQHRLPRWATRVSGPPGIERRDHESRFRQLRPAGHDRGSPMGAEKHRRIRRRPSQGDDFRRIGRGDRRQHVVRIAAGQRTVPGRHFAKRRLVRASAAHHHARRELETPGRSGALRGNLRQERGGCVHRGTAEDRRRQTAGRWPRPGHGLADY
jgi:hypothetical protein